LKNPLVSILIANYNNAKYIADCINSLKKQNYKKIEIIFFDDNSSDGSIKEIKKYKKVKIVTNKKKTSISSYNQMKAFWEAYRLSKGEIICLLDSDDYFHKKKIEKVVNHFKKDKEIEVLFDYPMLTKNKKIFKIKRHRKKLFNQWPYNHPTSCISLKRKKFECIYKAISINKYPEVWMDFRICLYSKYKIKKINQINDYLTYYRQHVESATSKHTYLSSNWWRRRMQSHNYLIYFLKKEKINFKNNADYYITKIYNYFIK